MDVTGLLLFFFVRSYMTADNMCHDFTISCLYMRLSGRYFLFQNGFSCIALSGTKKIFKPALAEN